MEMLDCRELSIKEDKKFMFCNSVHTICWNDVVYVREMRAASVQDLKLYKAVKTHG